MLTVHSQEEIEYYFGLSNKRDDVKEIAEKYDDQDLKDRVEAYTKVIDGELDKYKYLIGKKVFVPHSGDLYTMAEIVDILGFTSEDVKVRVERGCRSDVDICLTDAILYGENN